MGTQRALKARTRGLVHGLQALTISTRKWYVLKVSYCLDALDSNFRWQTSWSACLDEQLTFGKKSGGIFMKVCLVGDPRCPVRWLINPLQAFTHVLRMFLLHSS